MDKYALVAWHARVIQLAMQEPVAPYRPGTVTEDFVRHLASFSFVETGPRLAGEFLAKSGVRLVVVRHLPRTHLDGAAMMTMSGMPVVALTLRHDRLDNFWFTLCHELGHIALHFASGNTDSFIDDFDDSGALEQVESEADTFAADSLILPEVWRESAIAQHPTPEAVRALAASLRVHSAIVAGRIRRDVGNYRILSNLVGAGSVRRQFPGRESGVNVGSAIGYSA